MLVMCSRNVDMFVLKRRLGSRLLLSLGSGVWQKNAMLVISGSDFSIMLTNPTLRCDLLREEDESQERCFETTVCLIFDEERTWLFVMLPAWENL